MTLNQLYATILSLGVALAVLLPIHPAFRSERGDSFPLSWYPMFAQHRPEFEKVVYVIGRDAQHKREVIHLRYYSTGGMNTARLQMRRLTRNAEVRRATCERIAQRIANVKRGRMSEMVEIALVRGSYRLHDYFVKRDFTPAQETVLQRCDVIRDARSASKRARRGGAR